jgi:gliding motility-associated protein GldM
MLYKSNIYDKDKGNIKKNDDFDLLKQLYMELSKQERFEENNDVKNVHWIGKTFDHSPLVAALASLTAMQLEVLNARATAAGALAEKVVVAELSFNKLIALASISPSVANPGDPIELRVVMGAYDTDNMPDMGEGGWTIENGMAIKKMSAPSGDQTFSGTISIKAKSGAIKKENWETKIGVLTNEKTAAIETPDMQVFYEGIPIRLVAQATGMFKSVKMNVPSPYTAPKGSAGSTVNVTLTGTKADGTSASLGSKSFRVKKAPKPELLWNGVGTGQKAPKGSGGGLKCRYGNEVPFNPDFGQFQILSYYITFPGSKTPLEGVGSAISANHLSIIKGASGGVAIQVVVSGSYNGPVDATFK